MKTSQGKELRQISFFDEEPDARPEWPETCTQQTKRKGIVHKENFCINEDGKRPLTQWAFLLTSGRAGFIGYHFMMTREDAVKWCESKLSSGSLYGNPWAYFFISVENYAFHPWDGNAETGKNGRAMLDLTRMYDNGKYDEKIRRLGLQKYDKKQIKEVLAGYGIDVRI